MKMILRQRLWLTLVVVLNAALWLIPDDVVANIARDEQTMLGRYSRTHFAWNLAVALLTCVSLYVDWSVGRTYRRRWFQVIAVLLFLLPSLAILDFALRTPQAMHYVRDSIAYHHPPSAEFKISFEDRPAAHRTYPNAPPGYGTVECSARIDKRGYRNAADLDQYDIVALGDSFTEGSKVSDDHTWAARLAALTDRTVCNLGISAYDPFHYRESLREVGLSLRPRLVICMLYEGNDFRSAKSDAKRRNPSLSMRTADYFDRSPLIKSIDRLITDTFGPIRADAPLRDAARIDWLPLAIPPGPDARYYAFEPKQLRDLLVTSEEFSVDKHWLNPRGQIAEMNELCRKAGARFVLVLAPTKAHVVLPLVAGGLDPAKVRAFAAIDYKKPMPLADVFLTELVGRLDAKQSVIAAWCRDESIPFFAPTAALRGAVAEGRQTYYTYDQHWTPIGHETFARALLDFLREHALVESQTAEAH